MRVKYTESIEYKAINRLKQIRGSVVLRNKFSDLGSYRQISRVLNTLVAKKKLVRISSGIYAKAYLSPYSDTPLIKKGTDYAFRSALKQLGIDFDPGSAEQAYNEGKTTQIPARNIVKLKSRCRRQISYKNSKLIFENNINAK